MDEAEMDGNRPDSSDDVRTDTTARRVIILSGGDSVIPLARPLAEHFDLVVLEPNTAKSLAQSGLPVVNPAEVIPGGASEQANNLATVFAAKAMRPSFEKFGVKLKEPKNWFPGWLHTRLKRILFRIMAFDGLLEKREIAGLVVHNDVEEDLKTLVLWAKARGIPSIHVPHAIYHDTWRGPAGTDVHDICLADHLFAIGPFQKEWYEKRGAKDAELIGCPKWDKWSSGQDKAWAKKVLKLDDRPVVVYASSWHQQTSTEGNAAWHEEAYRAFLEVSKSFPDCQFIVKVHPRGAVGVEPHIGIAKQIEAKCMVTRGYLDICLNAADALVAFGPSNIVLEAAMLGVPSVSLGGYEEDEEVVTCGWEVEEIKKAIKRVLSGGIELDCLLAKYIHQPDGGAADRAVGRILEIC